MSASAVRRFLVMTIFSASRFGIMCDSSVHLQCVWGGGGMFRVSGFGLRVSGLGFKVSSLGFRV
jgi:hypothetical protein